MNTKLNILSAFFFFTFFYPITSLQGQALTYDALNPYSSNVSFTLGNLPKPAVDEFPFYQGFMILGDGNFIRLRAPENLHSPEDRMYFGNSYEFKHQYLNYTASYPGLLLLIDRKSGDDPPEASQQIIQPTNGTSNRLININGTDSQPSDCVEIRETVHEAPKSPMISGRSKIMMGYSHNNYNNRISERNRYYLENHRIGAFPIAYKPEAKGKLIFLYSNENDFSYYDQISFTQASQEIGTILSFYGEQAGYSLAERIKGMDAITNASTTDLISDNPHFDPKNFHDMIIVDIDKYDLTAYKSGEMDELRLFHFFKNEILQEGIYHFIAVLYDETDYNSNDKLRHDHDMSSYDNKITLPSSLKLPNKANLLKEFSYVDATMLSIKKGEPEDPNYLKVIDICKCDNDYQVTFELQFCNESTTVADGANILIQPIKQAFSKNVFQCFRLKSTFPDNTDECCRLQECKLNEKQYCVHKNEFFGERAIKYCLRFNGLRLVINSTPCGRITFTITMNSENITSLEQEPLIKFCVELYQDESVNPSIICGVNEVDKFLSIYNINENCDKPCDCATPIDYHSRVTSSFLRWLRSIFNRCCKT